MFRADSEEVAVAGVVVVLEAGVVGIGMAAVVSAGIDVVGTGVAVVVVLEEAVADVVDSVVAVGAKGMAVVRRDDSVAMVAAPINELNLIKYFLEIKSAEQEGKLYCWFLLLIRAFELIWLDLIRLGLPGCY